MGRSCRELHQHLDLARHRIGGGVDALDHAVEHRLRIAVDPIGDGLADLELVHAVGRDLALQAHGARVDDLDQLLADRGGVAGGDLALAGHAVEGRAHLGAAQLLARGDDACIGGGVVALRGVAADLGILERLHRGHALQLQGLQALDLALRLLDRLLGGARGLLGRAQAIADRGVVEAHQQIALAHRLAVFLQHLQHDGRDFGAQVGALLRLDRAGDDRALRLVGRAQRDEVFGRQQQGLGSGRLLGGVGRGTAIAGRQRDGGNDENDERG